MTAVILIQALAFAILSGIVASNKNRSAFGWGILGFLFSLFGFLAAVAVGEVEPEKKKASSRQKNQSSSTREFNPDEHEKKCPDCAEYIKLEARVCKHCGREFSEEEVEQQIEEMKEEEVISYSGEPPKVEDAKTIQHKIGERKRKSWW